MNFKSTLLLLFSISTSVAHYINATRTSLQPQIHLSTSGKASVQVASLMQQLKLSFLAAADNVTWEDSSDGRLIQDTLRQVHDNEMSYLKELHRLTRYRSTCNFTMLPESVDDYISLGRMLTSLVIGNLLTVSSTLAQESSELLPLISSLIAVNANYGAMLDTNNEGVALPSLFYTEVSDIWAYNAALNFAQPGSCENSPELPILGKLQTSSDRENAGYQRFSWNAENDPFLIEKGKQLFVAWVHHLDRPVYTALNITGEGYGEARIPEVMNGSFVMAGITAERPENINALALTTLAGPVVLNLSA